MPSPAWQLAQHSARLKLSAWEATLNVDRPAEGLRQWRCNDSICDLPVALLGVDLSSDLADLAAIEDVYVRGSDLVATYAATAHRPTRVQIYWRASSISTNTALEALSIDLQISVQTHLLDSDPALNARSSFHADELRRLLRSDAVEFGSCDFATVSVGQSLLATSADGPACVLARLTGSEFSYAEMVHPADHRRDSLTCEAMLDNSQQASGQCRLSHELFLPPLEKGVILRARLRGVLLPSEDDESSAFAAHSDLIAAEPPLTT